MSSSLLERMFKGIYVKVRQEEGLSTYRMVAVFDETFAQSIGVDDTGYSQIDNLIELLETDEDVIVESYCSLGQVLATIDRPTKRIEGPETFAEQLSS